MNSPLFPLSLRLRQSLLRYQELLTPSYRIALSVWFVLALGGYVQYSRNQAINSPWRDLGSSPENGTEAPPANHNVGEAKLLAELERSRQESSVLHERINHLESTLRSSNDPGRLTSSEQAIRKANHAKNLALANAAVDDLGRLRKLHSDWVALETTLMAGQAGSRIAGSAKHFPLFIEIWQRERPTVAQILALERQLTPLTDPIIQNVSSSTNVSITEERSKRLSDLGHELKLQAANLEHQKLFLESVQRETSTLPASSTTLGTALKQYRRRQEQAQIEALARTQAAERAAAEKRQAEQEAKRKQERIETEKRLREEAAREAERKRQAQMEAQAEAARRIAEAQLTSEMERDMDEINDLLAAFISPGTKYRHSGWKGPMSLSLIRSRHALERNESGITNLLWMARGYNDRPPGSLPRYVGGNLRWYDANSRPVQRAQELLIKYGDLMVKRGLLAP